MRRPGPQEAPVGANRRAITLLAPMSTRRLIAAALFCGLAILVAFALQVLLARG